MFRQSIVCLLGLALLLGAGEHGAAAAPSARLEGPIYVAPVQNEGSTTLFVTMEAGQSTDGPVVDAGVPQEAANPAPPPGSVPAPPEQKPEPLYLSAGPLVDEVSGALLSGRLTFKPDRLELGPKATGIVRVTASDVFFEGAAQADILDHGKKLGVAHVRRAPFAISLVEQEVALREGRRASLTLRNDTQHPLAVRWRLELGALQLCGPARPANDPETAGTNGASPGATVGALELFSCRAPANERSKTPPTLSIAPMSKATLDFVTPVGGGGWFDSFSTRTERAVLWLGVEDGLPRRDLTFLAHVEGHCFPGETVWVLCFLLLGAWMSLLVRHWVPNMQRKRELKAQLRRTELQVDDLSTVIQSQLREQTRSECKVLRLRLSSRLTVMPDYAVLAAECGPLLAMLERRVSLIERIDTAWGKLGHYWSSSPPPTRVDRIEDLLARASDGLAKLQPREDEILAIEKEIDRAIELAGQFTSLVEGRDDTFGTDLLARAQAAVAAKSVIAKEAAAHGFTSLFVTLEEALTALSAPIKPGSPTPSPAAVRLPPESWSKLDYTLRALEIWKEFVWLFGGSTPPTERPLEHVREALSKHLARNSWNELRLAERELKEIREYCTLDDIEKAIAAGEAQMYIDYEPKRIVYPQVVSFRARFRRDELNWSAAKERVLPEWSFAGTATSSERGCWEVSRLFLDPRSWRQKARDWANRFLGRGEAHGLEAVSVEFRRPGEDSPLQGAPLRASVAVDKAKPSDGRVHRFFSELGALLVSIAVPLLSLIAGAKEKLAQDPAAGALLVFLLGFSSDTVVSVFKQRTTRTPGGPGDTAPNAANSGARAPTEG